MSEILNSSINYHTFNVHDGDSLHKQVEKVVCVIMPRGFAFAGFSNHGDLLMMRYGDYDPELPPWILDFYEHHFLDEPMLADPMNVVATFIASDKYLIAPDFVYNETEATEWIKKLFFVEANEEVIVHPLHDDKAKYLYTIPTTVKNLVGRYFTASKILPLTAYQFYKPYKSDTNIQCVITPEQVFATMYKNRVLQWHQVFPFQVGEDIAYHLHLLCKEHKTSVENVELKCTVAFRGLNPIMNDMAQYFPNIKDGDANVVSSNEQWAPSISLMQQLLSCAS